MSWDKPSDAAAEAAVWSLIESEAKKRKDEARAWLTERMGPDLLAVKAVANGQDVGRASYVEGKPTLKVIDEAAFVEFVAENYPSEVETSTFVNTAFEKSLLDGAKVVGDVVVDGNGLVISGVQQRVKAPYVSVSKSKDAREKVAALLAGGGLSLDGIRALPEPEDKWTQDIEAGAIG